MQTHKDLDFERERDQSDDKFYTTEVLTFKLPEKKHFEMKVELLSDGQSSNNIWALDSMLIDEELLYAEDEEADKIYQDLKARTFRRRHLEEEESKLSQQMSESAKDEEEEEEQTNSRLPSTSS